MGLIHATQLSDRQILDEPYPAYYMQFGDDDPALAFAMKLRKTIAELYIGVAPDDMADSFHSQNEKLINR